MFGDPKGEGCSTRVVPKHVSVHGMWALGNIVFLMTDSLKGKCNEQ